MADIFISYDKADRARAQMLAGALEGEGWTVWWDRQIPPGRDYAEVIETELKAARCIVVLWSRESVASKWVRTEAAEGFERDILVPALIEDVAIPFEFKRVQAARLVDWRGAAADPELRQFVDAVRAATGHPPAAKPRAGFVHGVPSFGIIGGSLSRSIAQVSRGAATGLAALLAGFGALLLLESLSYGGEEGMALGAGMIGLGAWLWRKR